MLSAEPVVPVVAEPCCVMSCSSTSSDALPERSSVSAAASSLWVDCSEDEVGEEASELAL